MYAIVADHAGMPVLADIPPVLTPREALEVILSLLDDAERHPATDEIKKLAEAALGGDL